MKLERRRRNLEAQKISNVHPLGLDRKRRDVDQPKSSNQQCKCSNAVQFSRCSAASVQRMDGNHYDVSIKRFYDPNGVPVYDVLKFTPPPGTDDGWYFCKPKV